MFDISAAEAKDIGRRNAMHEVSDADLEAIALRVAERNAGLRNMAARREALVSQITALQKELQTLDEAARAAREDEGLWFHSTLIAPVRKVPNELLGAIFTMAAHGEYVPFKGPRSGEADTAPTSGATAMRIARTCKHWRDVAIGTPELWKRVSITFRGMGTSWEDEPLLDRMYDAVKAVEFRARPLRVELHLIPLRVPHGEVMSSWKRAVKVFFRRRTSYNWTPPRLHCSTKRLDGLGKRNLTSIADLIYDEVSGESVADVLTWFPSLEKLTLKNRNYDTIESSIPISPSRTLTRLALALPANIDIIPILKLVPCLETLRLKPFRIPGARPSISLTESVTLPLKILELQHGDGAVDCAHTLLAHLRLPMLQRLDIILSHQLFSGDIPSLRGVLANNRVAPKLELLRVAFTPWVEGPPSFFPHNVESYGALNVDNSYFSALSSSVAGARQDLSQLRPHEMIPSDHGIALLSNSGLRPGELEGSPMDLRSDVFFEDIFDALYEGNARFSADISSDGAPNITVRDLDSLEEACELLMDRAIPGQRSFALVFNRQIL